MKWLVILRLLALTLQLTGKTKIDELDDLTVEDFLALLSNKEWVKLLEEAIALF